MYAFGFAYFLGAGSLEAEPGRGIPPLRGPGIPDLWGDAVRPGLAVRAPLLGLFRPRFTGACS